jgi:hypothetical protein
MYMAVQIGYKNVLVGFLHAMFDSYYEIKLSALILAETGFLMFAVGVLSNRSVFIFHSKVWVNVVVGLLRILLIFTFHLEKRGINRGLEI